MKLYSAAGVDDLGNATSFTSTLNTPKYWSYTDVMYSWHNASYGTAGRPGIGLDLRHPGNALGFMLRDIIEEYPTGDCWIAVGFMAEQYLTVALPTSAESIFALAPGPNTPAASTQRFPGLIRNDINTLGGGKRSCAEIVFKPLTGEYKVYLNGIKRGEGTGIILAGTALKDQCVTFQSYDYGSPSQGTLYTDVYLGVVENADVRLGNFKVTKLISKQSSLPAGAQTMDGTAPTITGDHTVEYDVAPLAGQTVVGVVELIRAVSPGPTAAMSIKRKVNGVETAARKTSDIPTTFPQDLAVAKTVSKVGAPSADYVKGTALSEVKLSLSVVNN